MSLELAFDADIHVDRSKRGSTYKTPNGNVLVVIDPAEPRYVICMKPDGELVIRSWAGLRKYEYLGWQKLTISIDKQQFFPQKTSKAGK